MFRVAQFAEDRLEVQQALIRSHPLGLLICTQEDSRITADALPFVLTQGSGDLGVLQAHMPRQNPLWKALETASECLIVFQGPQAYISPNWYPSKQKHGKVVPTWNYVTVHARGFPQVIDSADWVRQQIRALTTQQEAGNATPWQVEDAPASFTSSMVKALIGIEVELTDLQGKWKVSQNRPAEDRTGVHTALMSEGMDEMAAEVFKYGGE